MRLIDRLFAQDPRDPALPATTQLTGPRVALRMGLPTDWQSWRQLRGLSRDFLKPWEPSWPRDALSRSFFEGMLRRHRRDWQQGLAYGFLAFLRHEQTLIGGIGLNDVRRGIGQKATLGYWIGEPYAGKGYTTEAASLTCDFGFRTLKLHRLEASCLPQNEPSRKLLQRLGFAEEGFAKSYLRIDGEWRDHMLWGKVK